MRYYIIVLFAVFSCSLFCQEASSHESRVISTIDSTHADNLVLTQTFEVAVPIDQVWEAYTTKQGWENWAVAQADIDLRLGGLIQTSYDSEMELGDAGTIKLWIINFVPKKMITMQADIAGNFPAFMKDDVKHMYNTVLFESTRESSTKVTSYGIGYKNNDQYKPLLDFFIQGNEMSYLNLIKYLETGEPSANY